MDTGIENEANTYSIFTTTPNGHNEVTSEESPTQDPIPFTHDV